MTAHLSILTTLCTAFGLALVFGYLAERFLKTPALVGYIIAGVAVTLVPGLPHVDRDITQQFSEIGIILLMFGVGLHFSVSDLLKVKGVAVTGALTQMTVSTIAGTLLAMYVWDWSVAISVCFGLTLSCASTVVVTKALEMRRLTNTPSGMVAFGWLIVQDLVTVFIMVCLPLLSELFKGAALDWRDIVISFSQTLLGVFIFAASMLVVGRRVLPWILMRIGETGSRELFTLCVIAIPIGIAYGAGVLFQVSFALGAFFAGMVMRESKYAHRAAKNSLPFQDAFAVLFFVSVGMMLDWRIFIDDPLAVLGVMVIILLVTSTVGGLLVVLLGWPLDTALVLAANLAQVGEFSFILLSQGISLGLASNHTMTLIVAASILTIAINPIVFAGIPHLRHFLVTHSTWLRRAAMRDAPGSAPAANTPRRLLNGHVIMAGESSAANAVMAELAERDVPVVCITSPNSEQPLKDKDNITYFSGDSSDPMVLVKAHIMTAALLVLPSKDLAANRQILATARQLKPALPIYIRAVDPEEAVNFRADEHTTVVCDVAVVAGAMAGEALYYFGKLNAGPAAEEDEDETHETAPEKQAPEARRGLRDRMMPVMKFWGSRESLMKYLDPKPFTDKFRARLQKAEEVAAEPGETSAETRATEAETVAGQTAEYQQNSAGPAEPVQTGDAEKRSTEEQPAETDAGQTGEEQAAAEVGAVQTEAVAEEPSDRSAVSPQKDSELLESEAPATESASGHHDNKTAEEKQPERVSLKRFFNSSSLVGKLRGVRRNPAAAAATETQAEAADKAAETAAEEKAADGTGSTRA